MVGGTTSYGNEPERQALGFPRREHKPRKFKAGQLVVARLYDNNTTGNTLNELRFQLFAKSLSKHRFNLASLPPTESAARGHSLRTYHQVQTWYGKRASDVPESA
ncbi:hypothetical protein NQ314_007039 [Rhamnusium bicolor]|uniref:Uncharacterized protein n=1 Tax=Rhamnusium bicolor TaxID=1586634 RepID=A0AAV8YUM9_9CUCU|nr:hypothetical protein NQ314_007039 [Rhamnusium bicolor]